MVWNDLHPITHFQPRLTVTRDVPVLLGQLRNFQPGVSKDRTVSVQAKQI